MLAVSAYNLKAEVPRGNDNKFQKRQKSKFLRNFKWPFPLRGLLRSTRNFGKTRFRPFDIFDFSMLNCFLVFFAKIFGVDFFFLVNFWRINEFLSVIGTFVVKSYCLFWGDFIREGANDSICVKILDLARKLTLTIRCCDWMII